MTRITQADVDYWTGEVNRILAANDSRYGIQTRQHGTNNFAVIEQTDVMGRPIHEPFFAGTKREVYETLRAMVRMHQLLTDA